MSHFLNAVRNLPVSAVVAGIIATVISFAGPLVIVFQAAASLGAERTESWIWAIAMGSGVLGIVLSLRYRVPLVIAWSAPGSALLVSILPGMDFGVAVGSYIVAGVLIPIVGLTRAFDKVVSRLPAEISAGLLAGILLRFLLDLGAALGTAPILALAMVGAYVGVRRFSPRYALIAAVVVGVAIAVATGAMGRPNTGSLALTVPVWTWPVFEWRAIVSIAIPLSLVSLWGQFLLGVAVLRAAGYDTPSTRPIITSNSIVSILLAPFGCHGLNIAAFTAAICLSPEAHPDPAKRYVAAVSGGVAYLVFGAFAGAVMAAFSVLPPALIAVLAGLALLPVVATSLAEATRRVDTRDAALITFVVTASGISLLGLGAAFWGIRRGSAWAGKGAGVTSIGGTNGSGGGFRTMMACCSNACGCGRIST